MNKNFTYNFVTKEIVGSKACIARANKGINPEFRELTDMLREHPDFNVVEKVIKKNKNKKTFHALTIDRMKDYIKTQPNSSENLEKIDAVIEIAKAKRAMYPLTKKWFLATFPEYKESEIAIESEKAEMLESLEVELDALNEVDMEVA